MIAAFDQSFVDDLVRRSHLMQSSDPVDVAVSGGPDSMALLVLACATGRKVTAHHVDHQLRTGSGDEADLVATAASTFGADLVRHVVQVEPGSNVEARARSARFEVLPSGVATGHTLDDRAETMILNLLRGAGSRGLSPLQLSPRHPIVTLRRSETHELCGRLGLAVVDDPSNRDPAHLRNRVRHEVLPLFDELAGRDVAAILDRQADLFADEDRFIDQAARCLDATDARAMTLADPVLARRCARLHIEQVWSVTHPPSAGVVERYLSVARGDAVAADLSDNYRVLRTNQRLRIESM